MASRFDTERLLSRTRLLTYALQGLINDAEGGSEIEEAQLRPVFELALELETGAKEIHSAAPRVLHGDDRGEADQDDDDRHAAHVFCVEQSILAELEQSDASVAVSRRDMVERATGLVKDRLAPVDTRAAKIFLDEILTGELP